MPPAALHGEVVHFFACDIAYDMQRIPMASLLGCPLLPFLPDTRKHSPRGRTLYRPLTAKLPDSSWDSLSGPISLQCSIKVLPVGALSVTIRTPFAVNSLSELTNPLRFNRSDGLSIAAHAASLMEQARAELASCSIRPHPSLPPGEAYTVFCLDSSSPAINTPALAWLDQNRRDVAALLTSEPDASVLSDQEVSESTSRPLSYYHHDLIAGDWDAALIIDRPADFDESLYVIELANVQLEELEAYDTYLDDALERAYRDLSRHARRSGILTELHELRIDLARFSDELSNITKFFGEWHLARVYENSARLFHLADWHRAIDEKLRTLDSLYEMLKQDRNHKVMLWLEAGIVLLFILDLAMIFAGTHK
jgi:hypothetical protein